MTAGLAAALVVAACEPTRPTTPTEAAAVTPTSIGDGWPLSDPAAEGLDPGRLTALSSSIASGRYGHIDALVIVRNGRLCFDGNYHGTPFALHEMQSVTKSVTSALVGAAIARGSISGIEQPVTELLPEIAAAAETDPAKSLIHVEHLL